MPNGGVPIHMMLRPKISETHVIYCHGAELKIIPNKEWERAKGQGKPDVALNQQEAKVLERFLRYWLQDNGDGPLYDEQDVNAVFDF